MIKNYEKYDGSWNSFTSTTTELSVAEWYAGKNGIIFEIYLDPHNPHPHV